MRAARIAIRRRRRYTEQAPPPPPKKWIEPFGAIAGGVRLESLHRAPGEQTGSQNPTVAVSRLGVRGGVGEHITYASEFEASLGGPLGYGASVWEGQAAIAIRDQFVRYSRAGWSFAAGRIDDPASYDYVSAHVGNLLYSDVYTRDPLLYSGADRGNGLWASYDVTSHARVGLTVHSTNPTGITGTLIIGGKLMPFDRPFYLAAAQVGNSQNNLPDQNLHIYFGSPSVMVHYDHFQAQTEVQLYSLDTQESITSDQPIRGYNLRLGAKTWFDTAAGRVTPFANVSRNKNEILDPTDSKYRLPGSVHVLHRVGGHRPRLPEARRHRLLVRDGRHARARSARARALPQPRHHLLDRGLARDRRACCGVRAANQRRDGDDGQPLGVRDGAPVARLELRLDVRRARRERDAVSRAGIDLAHELEHVVVNLLSDAAAVLIGEVA